MSEMVEKVARAIRLANHKHEPGDDGPWSEFLARAAIEAMREPTEGMHDAGQEAVESLGCDEDGLTDWTSIDHAKIFDAMIEAALSVRDGSPPGSRSEGA